MVKHDVKTGKLDYCQITGSKNLFEAIDLGFQPPCGTLLTQNILNNPETYYPLRLMICPQSGLGQLDYVLGSQVCFPLDY
ncbi:MAG: C-methyltransferase, partial [uncultured bacterium]